MGSCHNIGVVASGAACDHALLNHKLSIYNLVGERKAGLGTSCHALCFLFHGPENVAQVFVQLVDLIRIAGMEGQGDHGLDGA